MNTQNQLKYNEIFCCSSWLNRRKYNLAESINDVISRQYEWQQNTEQNVFLVPDWILV